MKRSLLAVVVLLTALARPSVCRAADPTLTIAVQPGGDSVKVTLSEPKLACSSDEAQLRAYLVDDPTMARPPSNDLVYRGNEVSSAVDLVVPADAPHPPRWLFQLLTDPGTPVKCLPAATGTPTTLKTLVTFPTAPPVAQFIQPPTGVDPESAPPNTLVWSRWSGLLYRRIWQTVGVTVGTCAFDPPITGSTCTATLADGTTSDTKVVNVTYTGQPVRAGSVKVTIGKLLLQLPILACQYPPQVNALRSLLAGADVQQLELDGGAQCGGRLRGQRLQLHSGNVIIAAGQARSTAAGSTLLSLQSIPDSVAPGTWLIETDAGVRLGSVALGVVAKPIEVRSSDGAPLLGIHYDIDDIGMLDLDQWHDGKSVNGRAVVTSSLGEHFNYIQNTATISLDPQLMNVARGVTHSDWDLPGATLSKQPPQCSTRANNCADLDTKAENCAPIDLKLITPVESAAIDECHAHRRAWRVRAHTWQDSVWLKEDVWWRNAQPAFSDELGEVTFAVFSSQPHPFQVAIELVDRSTTGAEETVIFRKYVTLANAAQPESLPLPLARALYIECGHHEADGAILERDVPETDASADVVLNGFTRAVNDEDILTGGCRIHYSPRVVARMFKQKSEAAANDLLKYYGRQELTVTVHRGEASESTTWSIDPVLPQELELPVPRDAKNAIGIYSVTAALRGPLPPAVTWRHASTSRTLDTTNPGLGDLEFHANLRPRGPFGWKAAPIRVFMTFPVSFTGVRFPARPTEVSRSSAFPNAQVTKIQAGALLALEPWNYDTGRNPWPVPTRFMTGMNFYNASDGQFTPSWLTGVSFTFPIVDLQKGITEDQLSSDLALGLFWEADVGHRRWYSSGNHFLITLGINLLSLFGSK